MTPAAPSTAYDLELLKEPPARGTERDHGWCYGLPPGIAQEQWPLSPHDGFPMQHCFTLCIPEQYRTKGRDLVALTMFADQQHDDPKEVEEVAEYLAADTVGPLRRADLLPFWKYRLNRHPMEFRMRDAIDRNYAAIWLTEAEFTGPLCTPPDLAGNLLLQQNPPPSWLEKGLARAVFDVRVGCHDSNYENCDGLEQKYWYRLFGRIPEVGHNAYGIAIAAREGDPNVGKPPRDEILHADEPGNYIQPYGKEGEAIELKRFHGRNHLGGTMFPSQWTPRYSPTYLEIEEEFGGFNFGAGNGQLDLATMAFEWACG
ncbi:MAG: hypothetical protein HY852_25305 [Bradyrhizobium sp.]|uniref:hypothetical protein n=1 Tax=Bradyrhizobium sp. TaxID=376 RepID=UPI0025C08CFF|nr:hypothetical protein [Bradyrhizobium sp.]MBI5265125.1 hypothetical protein [Bradyrhizobium sp.]